MTVFADAFFFIALINRRDEYHEVVRNYSDAYEGVVVTTQWILTEVADAFSASASRQRIKALVTRLESSSSVIVVEASAKLFHRGLDLYHSRADKHWSLTDCISFVVMTDRGLSESLTGDRLLPKLDFTQSSNNLRFPSFVLRNIGDLKNGKPQNVSDHSRKKTQRTQTSALRTKNTA